MSILPLLWMILKNPSNLNIRVLEEFYEYLQIRFCIRGIIQVSLEYQR